MIKKLVILIGIMIPTLLYSVNITVWVHGTYPALSLLTAQWSPIRKMVYVEPGLSLAQRLPDSYYFSQLARTISAQDPIEYDLQHFYVYGWHSSNVRPGHRIAEGAILYHKLNKLIKKYKKQQHEEINIRCVGFSHGGNVILNMLSHLPFKIDGVKLEVVLFGTPVQESTRHYINCCHVHKAYSFYSQGDWIQKIDVQKFHHNCPKDAPFLSQRTFLDGDNVYQICLTINGKKIGHMKYRYIMHHLPKMLAMVNQLCMQTDAKYLNLDYKL